MTDRATVPGPDRDDLLSAVRRDLADEVASLAAVVADLDAEQLKAPTPADGWSVTDQLSHLAAFDDHAVAAITDTDRFAAEVRASTTDGVSLIVAATERGRSLGPVATREWWYRAAADLRAAAACVEPGVRLPWFGPDMGVVSFLTARLMETWAHGQDVRDAMGVGAESSDRLRHVAELGIRARPYSYRVRGATMPDRPIRVELDAGGGTVWTWGDPAAVDVVSGSALDFSLLVTQRRHRDDLSLEVIGDAADEWVGIAQAFAGGPGAGRPPLP